MSAPVKPIHPEESWGKAMRLADAAVRAGECPACVSGLSRERVYCDLGAHHDRHGGGDRHEAMLAHGMVIHWR